MKVALVGNQNCGKTTLFNALTDEIEKVGNWPGVTIQKKEGKIKNTNIQIIDLPGIYSLNPFTKEEEISKHYLMNEKYDVIINVVDVTSLHRSLYLTTQLFDLDCPLILVLNMTDLLKKEGIDLNISLLKQYLNVEVIEVSALKKKGIAQLISSLQKPILKNKCPIFPQFIEKEINLPLNYKQHSRYHHLQNITNNPKIINEVEKVYHMEIDHFIANCRYEYIEKTLSLAMKKRKKKSITDQLDAIFLNKYLAFPIFILIMAFIYFLSIELVGKACSTLISNAITTFSNYLQAKLIQLEVSNWLIHLVCDGIITGVGAILNFIPQLIALFFCLTFLQTSGYLSRIAFFLDRFFIYFGLSGKSFIPFILGLGCSVPGILSTRTIENDSQRNKTIVLTPFIPCSAKLPIIALFSNFFFKQYAWFISFSLYVLAIIVILISALLMKKVFHLSSDSCYISELPSYKLPHLSYILDDVGENTFHFLKRSGSIILISSICAWFLLSFSFDLQYIHNDIERSILASIGKKLSWIFYPIIGELNWGATVSSFQGLIAKEQVISSMSIIEEVTSHSVLFNQNGMFKNFTPLSAYSFMVFNLFSAPCFGAISAMRQELKSRRRLIKAIGFQCGVAWLLASFIYLFGRLLEGIFV